MHSYLIPKSPTGFGLQIERVNRGLVINYISQNSPASRSNLKEGDLIVKCDGHDVDASSYNQVKKTLVEANALSLGVRRSKPIVGVTTNI